MLLPLSAVWEGRRGIGDLRFQVASFRSQEVWGEPGGAHAAPAAGAPRRADAGSAPSTAGTSCSARSEGGPGALPGRASRTERGAARAVPPARWQDVFLLESRLFWVRPGHESSPRALVRRWPRPSPSCLQRLPVASAAALLRLRSSARRAARGAAVPPGAAEPRRAPGAVSPFISQAQEAPVRGCWILATGGVVFPLLPELLANHVPAGFLSCLKRL